MNKNILIGILVVVVMGGAFYWFQVRPAQARKDCIKMYPGAFGMSESTTGRLARLDSAGYEKCLREHGLEK